MPKFDKYRQTDYGSSEIPFLPSDIETADRSLYNWIRDLKISTNTSHGDFKQVPVVWSTAERSFLSKKTKENRDREGTLNYPLITIERTNIEKSATWKGTAWGNVPQTADEKGGSIEIARRINPDKTSNFANADAKRHKGQINFPRKNKKVVYETISIPMPTYIDITYMIKLKSQFQTQMNDMMQPFITKTGGIKWFIAKEENHKFEGFIQDTYEHNNNISNMGMDERMFETSIIIKLLAYIIGEGKNQDNPKLIKRENRVQLRFLREHLIVQDDPDNLLNQDYVGAVNLDINVGRK